MAKDRLVHKINVPENRTEYVPESWTLQWNMVKGEYEYAPPNAKHIVNLATGETELREEGESDRHQINVPANRTDLGGKNWRVKHDLINDEFVLRPTIDDD